MHLWFKRRARRLRVINADAEKFHKSFELLNKYQAVRVVIRNQSGANVPRAMYSVAQPYANATQ